MRRKAQGPGAILQSVAQAQLCGLSTPQSFPISKIKGVAKF